MDICKIIETINQKDRAFDKGSKKKRKDDGDGCSDGCSAGQESTNKGKLLTDATCTPADITFPIDLEILNEAREKVKR